MKSALKFLFLLLSTFQFLAVSGKEPNYNCSSISDSLMKHANAVVRNLREEIKIVSPGEVYITTIIAITVLNEKGKQYGILRELNDRFVHSQEISARLYDANGEEIRKLKQYQIKEVAPYSYNFVDDYHYKVADFEYSSYPYTCEFETVSKLNTTFMIRPWSPKEGYDCAVESADISVVYPKDFPLRYRTFHVATQVVTGSDGDNNTLSLSLHDIHAGGKPDVFSPPDNYYYPTLVIAPDKFAMGDNIYGMSTWREFGAFFYKLNETRDELTDELKKTVHRLTDTCRNANEKIRLLYGFLQKNTRYVSIQLGIGGWQAFDAKFLSDKGYGDCKALSNYMKAMLKESGITSYHVLIRGGENGDRMIDDFPYNVFNHAILCVPQQDDTVWLECTSQANPPGYLSYFTSEREALLITPDGGFPVKTPVYDANVSKATRRADFYIDEKDDVRGVIDNVYSGYWWDIEEGRVVNEPKSKIENYLNSKFLMPNYQVDSFKIDNNVSSQIPSVKEVVAVSGNGIVARSGKNIFLSANILSLGLPAPDTYGERKRKFYIGQSYLIADTLTFHLAGKYVLSSPVETSVNYPFANYRVKATMIGDSILEVTVLYLQAKGLYIPEFYSQYLDLSKKINADARNERIMLTKKD